MLRTWALVKVSFDFSVALSLFYCSYLWEPRVFIESSCARLISSCLAFCFFYAFGHFSEILGAFKTSLCNALIKGQIERSSDKYLDLIYDDEPLPRCFGGFAGLASIVLVL